MAELATNTKSRARYPAFGGRGEPASGRHSKRPWVATPGISLPRNPYQWRSPGFRPRANRSAEKHSYVSRMGAWDRTDDRGHGRWRLAETGASACCNHA